MAKRKQQTADVGLAPFDPDQVAYIDVTFAGPIDGEITAPAKVFKSGKIGWWGQARVRGPNGIEWMVQFQAVKVGS